MTTTKNNINKQKQFFIYMQLNYLCVLLNQPSCFVLLCLFWYGGSCLISCILVTRKISFSTSLKRSILEQNPLFLTGQVSQECAVVYFACWCIVSWVSCFPGWTWCEDRTHTAPQRLTTASNQPSKVHLGVTYSLWCPAVHVVMSELGNGGRITVDH